MIKNNKFPWVTKPTLTQSLTLSFGLAVAGIFGDSAQAATITKANNVDDLNLTTSWTAGVVPGAADTALWDGTVTGPNSVSLGADLSWQGVAITSPGGPVTIGGSNTLTLGSAGIDMSAATQSLTINSNLALLGNTNQTWNVASGQTLTVNPTTFTRNVGATLNLQGAGTVATSTITNATVIVGTTPTDSGIVGAWATIGSGTSLSYATVSAGTIIPLTGSAAFGTGSNNYAANLDLTGNVALSGGSSSRGGNTIRNTGAFTITLATNRNLQLTGGLMNAGTGTLTIAAGGTGVLNPLSNELVFSTNTQNITVTAPITDKAFGTGGATVLTIQSQGGAVILSGANSYTGGTVLNSGGIVSLGNNAGLGTGVLTMASGTTLTATTTRTISNNITLNGAATFRPSSNTVFTINGIISGSGSLTKTTATGADTLTLSAANTYTGVTNINAGTLLLSTGSIASTAVNVSVGALTLNNATALADTLTLSLVSGTALNLNAASGTSEIIGALILDGTSVANGTYTVAQLSSLDPNIIFNSGSGETLTIASVPEPSTLVSSLLLLGAVGIRGRRRVQSWARRARGLSLV